MSITNNYQNQNTSFTDDEDCIECESILEGLENIDDEADVYGVDFVKNNEALAAKQYNVYHTPALVYFRKRIPIVYDGDMNDEEKVDGIPQLIGHTLAF